MGFRFACQAFQTGPNRHTSLVYLTLCLPMPPRKVLHGAHHLFYMCAPAASSSHILGMLVQDQKDIKQLRQLEAHM